MVKKLKFISNIPKNSTLQHCVRAAYTFTEKEIVSAVQRQFSWTHLRNTEHIEYLMLDEQSPIKVAQYYTRLPDKKVLAEKMQRAIAIAKAKYSEQL